MRYLIALVTLATLAGLAYAYGLHLDTRAAYVGCTATHAWTGPAPTRTCGIAVGHVGIMR